MFKTEGQFFHLWGKLPPGMTAALSRGDTVLVKGGSSWCWMATRSIADQMSAMIAVPHTFKVLYRPTGWDILFTPLKETLQ